MFCLKIILLWSWSKILICFNYFSGTCLKSALSKSLGFGIVGGSLLGKYNYLKMLYNVLYFKIFYILIYKMYQQLLSKIMNFYF